MKTAFAFLLLAASAQAFLPAAAPKMPARAVKAAPTMKLDAKNAAYAIAASPILLSASSALATEGTGEPFGYDNIAQVVCQVRHRAVLARDPAARALRASGWRVAPSNGSRAAVDALARSNERAAAGDEPEQFGASEPDWGLWAELALFAFLLQGWARSVHWPYWLGRLGVDARRWEKAGLSKAT